ncbi:GNAT family N-acetyltransferase [Thermogemmatispora sp.]|uniref:GNAT family N-acetyltransferase n=1 Tax=Thermogemmatispora sp. TaxID=1968838 RepID=UPI0035E43555
MGQAEEKPWPRYHANDVKRGGNPALTNEELHQPQPIQRSPAELAAIWSAVRTPRLLLRRLRAEDGPAMFRIHGDPATYQYSPESVHRSLASSEAMLQLCRLHWAEHGFGYWAVERARDQLVIGFGGLEQQLWHKRSVLNLYYRLTPSAWGQGYATEMARTALQLAREYLPHLPIIARIRAANLPSQQVALKVGLRRLPPEMEEPGYYIFASEPAGW